MQISKQELFDEIIYSANLLIRQTQVTDVLVFIGQSPNYLSYIVETQRNVIRVPISGRYFIDTETIPNVIELVGFKKMLDDLGLSRVIESGSVDNLILIDHSHSGQSISSFGLLLNVLYGINRTYNFINVVTSVQAYNGWIIRPKPYVIYTKQFLIMPSLVAIANNGYPRSIPSYQYWKWHNAPVWVSDDTILGLEFVSEMMEYYRIGLDSEQAKLTTYRYDIRMIYPLFGTDYEMNIMNNMKVSKFSINCMNDISVDKFMNVDYDDIKFPKSKISLEFDFNQNISNRKKIKSLNVHRQHFNKSNKMLDNRKQHKRFAKFYK
jgi:hypothetical protein